MLRIRRRGLSTACIEGMLASAAPVIAVMDGDMQHDETRLPVMLRAIRDEGADLVIGTRYADGGSLGGWDPSRAAMSRLATRLSHSSARANVSDPLSGFFMLRRELLDGAVRGLSGMGFKILLDLIASAKVPITIAEVPYTFRTRFAGQSKLDTAAVWEFAMLLADKLVGRYVPVRFVAFAIVGGAGVLVHMAVMAALLSAAWSSRLARRRPPPPPWSSTTRVNNELTYRDRRRRGGMGHRAAVLHRRVQRGRARQRRHRLVSVRASRALVRRGPRGDPRRRRLELRRHDALHVGKAPRIAGAVDATRSRWYRPHMHSRGDEVQRLSVRTTLRLECRALDGRRSCS